MSQYQRGPVYQESLGSPGCCSVGCSVRVCRPAFPTPPARRPSAPPTRSPRTCPRPTCRQSSSLRSVHTCPQPILTLDQSQRRRVQAREESRSTNFNFSPTRNINSDVSSNRKLYPDEDVRCVQQVLTHLLLGCQSVLQEIPISNPVPRGAFTLAQESRRMSEGGGKGGEKPRWMTTTPHWQLCGIVSSTISCSSAI